MKEIDELLSTNKLDKKTIHKKFCNVLENICFHYLDSFSRHVYTSTNRQNEYTSFCGKVFIMINDSCTRCFKMRSSDEFRECWMDSVGYTVDLATNLHRKLKFLGEVPDKPDMQIALETNNEKIYKSLFARTRKPRKRKVNNGKIK